MASGFLFVWNSIALLRVLTDYSQEVKTSRKLNSNRHSQGAEKSAKVEIFSLWSYQNLKGLSSEIYLAESVIKGEAPKFSADFVHPPSGVRSPWSDGAISYKIWDMIDQFPITVRTVPMVAAYLLPRILIFPIPLTHRLESRSNGGLNSSHQEATLQVY